MKCKYCEDQSQVFMREKQDPINHCSIACICDLGRKYASLIQTSQKTGKKYASVQWNGQKEQIIKGSVWVFDLLHRFQDIVFEKRTGHNHLGNMANYQDTE